MLDSEVKQNVVVAKNADTMLKQESVDALSPQVLEAYRKIAARNAVIDFELTVEPIGGKGENSYGSVLKVCLTPTQTSSRQSSATPLHTILKMAPTSQARRIHMRVKDMYAREVFMYAEVFSEFEALSVQLNNNNNNNNNKVDASAYQTHFNVAPQMLHSSLADGTEFIIFEDLTTAGYTINSRVNLPTYDLVVCAFRAIAQLHAMSFVLQARQPQRFTALVSQMDDNLFTADMEVVSIEFGKKSVRRTRQMFESDLKAGDVDTPQIEEVLEAQYKIEANFHEICLDAVNGAANAPYAVICHGDFWNNNILYEFDPISNTAIKAKLIDFQISRYSAPVLDLVHYLYACTEKPLRDAHFDEFMQIYYDTLTDCIRDYDLDPKVLYPEAVFRQQLRQFGVYGYCMSAFAVPFFVSNASELPDLDKVSEAIQELTSSSSSSDSSDTDEVNEEDASKGHRMKAGKTHVNTTTTVSTRSQNATDFVDELDILTERTLPIFKRRMIGNVLDLQKYGMIEAILKY